MSDANPNSKTVQKCYQHIFNLNEYFAQYGYTFTQRKAQQNEQPSPDQFPINQKVFLTNKGIKIDVSFTLNENHYCLSNQLTLLDTQEFINQQINILDSRSKETRTRKQSLDSQECQDLSTTILPEEQNDSDESRKLSKQLRFQKPSKSDKKNVVKNFMKAFKGYILSWGDPNVIKKAAYLSDDKDLQEFRKNYQQFEKKRKYNNRLMKEMIQSRVYRNIFRHFLEIEAVKWLESSLVQDKAGHKTMLKYYVAAFDDPDLLEKMKILKSKDTDSD